MSQLDERFNSVVKILAATNTQYSAANDTTDIADAKVYVPNKPPAGTTYRVKMTGTKTGTNAAMKVHLKIGSTQVVSLTAPGNTAVDWVAEFLIRFTDSKNQRASGSFLSNAAAVVVDYAAGTVDLSAGAALVAQIQSQHASDTVTCESCTVESWIK